MRIRKLMHSDSEKAPPHYKYIRTKFQTDDRHWKRIFAKTLFRPFALFAREPIAQLMGVYMAFVYGLLYSEHILTFESEFRG